MTALPPSGTTEVPVRKANAKTAATARNLYAQGHTFAEIHRHLHADGYRVSKTSIRRWVDPQVAEQHRDASRKRQAELRAHKRRQGKAGRTGAPLSPLGRLDRMRELHAAGMSYEACSVLARVEYGIHVPADRLRYLMQAREVTPTLLRRLMTPQERQAA